MKKILIAASLLIASAAASAQTGVSISVGQPGFYGRIDIGNTAPPPVIFAEPVIVHRPVRVIEAPLYLRVPPGHEKKWSKHCSKYNACGRKVYFVRDDWYRNDYAPRYVAQHGGGKHQVRHDDRRDDRRDDRHDDRRDDRRDDHPGKGHGNGHGNGNGHGHGKGKD